MDDSRIIVSLDIGTTAMKVVVANIQNSQANIIGIGSAHSQGMDRGVIVDIDQAATAISEAIKKASSQSNTDIKDVVVGLPASGLQIFKAHAMVALNGQSKEINNDDVQEVMSASVVQTLPPELEFVTLLPSSFSVDGFTNVNDPRGMIGNRLEFNGVLYALPKSILHNVKRVVQRAGLNLIHEILAPLALAKVALNKGERDFGTVVIDLGGGQTSASVIHDNKLKFTAIDPEGGNLVAHDISVVLNTTLDNAEKLKHYYGNADVQHSLSGETIPVEVVGQEQNQNISGEYLASIISARLQQIFERLKRSLDHIKAQDLPGGVILTGGLAEMSGIKALAQQVLQVKTKTFIPEQMGLRHPSFAEGLGLVLYTKDLNDLDLIAYDVVHEPVSKKTRVTSSSRSDSSPRTENSGKEKPPKSISTGEKIKNFWSRFFD
ncbi:cell division protein FtsA [Bombilactobacillus folatiphilus]|uniref:Cell division protein FtsA n=1 Tax=Bombilactobacillus folatiphilus TaxID=2923362 RepID=A0ABY4PAN5_9LACO|nr:cell division protein FtsA [Bombilactobacillus folatiphilus]UQS82706.1 cell division protein FtsA [Bombilactobacillus folatiphilus]